MTIMEQIDQLNEIQRKVELIIHSTPHEWRLKQPGVSEFREMVLQKIVNLRMELVQKEASREL